MIRFSIILMLGIIVWPFQTQSQPEDKPHKIYFQYAMPEKEVHSFFSKYDDQVASETLHTGITSIYLNKEGRPEYVDWNIPTEQDFLKKAPKSLKLAFQSLPDRLMPILALSDRPVVLDIILVDDRKGLVPDSLSMFSLFPLDQEKKSFYVLPDGNNLPISEASDRINAWLYIGATAIEKMAKRYLAERPAYKGEEKISDALYKEVIGHLASHACLKSILTGDVSRWGHLDQRALALLHPSNLQFQEELWEDQAYALVHGLGRYYGYRSAKNDFAAMLVLDGDDPNLVMAEGSSLLSKDLRKFGKPDMRFAKKTWRFHWHTLPGEHLLHSEAVVSKFFEELSDCASDTYPDRYRKMVDVYAKEAVSNPEKRYLAYAANLISKQIAAFLDSEEAFLAEREGDLEGQYGPALPYALLDALTHFSIDADQLERMYKAHDADNDPQILLEYLHRGRPKLKVHIEEIWHRSEKKASYMTIISALNSQRK